MKPDIELIKKFLRDECTGPEAEQVHRYFQDNPEELDHYLPIEEWLSDTAQQADADTSAGMLQSIRRSYAKLPNKLLLRYAAAACLIGLLTLTGIKYFQPNEQRAEKMVRAATGTTWQKTANTTTEPITEMLSDHSLVTISPNSSIEYLPAFESRKRDIYLKGKAEFKVQKDASRPFTVYAENITITALGTDFIISVTDNRKVTVSLIEGRVKVRSQNPAELSASVIMQAGDKLVITSGEFAQHSLSHSAKIRSIKSPEKDSIKQNNLVFKNQYLKDVLKRIEEKFDVTISAPGLEEKLFTGTFLETDDLEIIIRLISQLQGRSYNIEGKIVTIQ